MPAPEYEVLNYQLYLHSSLTTLLTVEPLAKAPEAVTPTPIFMSVNSSGSPDVVPTKVGNQFQFTGCCLRKWRHLLSQSLPLWKQGNDKTYEYTSFARGPGTYYIPRDSVAKGIYRKKTSYPETTIVLRKTLVLDWRRNTLALQTSRYETPFDWRRSSN